MPEGQNKHFAQKHFVNVSVVGPTEHNNDTTQAHKQWLVVFACLESMVTASVHVMEFFPFVNSRTSGCADFKNVTGAPIQKKQLPVNKENYQFGARHAAWRWWMGREDGVAAGLTEGVLRRETLLRREIPRMHPDSGRLMTGRAAATAKVREREQTSAQGRSLSLGPSKGAAPPCPAPPHPAAERDANQPSIRHSIHSTFTHCELNKQESSGGARHFLLGEDGKWSNNDSHRRRSNNK